MVGNLTIAQNYRIILIFEHLKENITLIRKEKTTLIRPSISIFLGCLTNFILINVDQLGVYRDMLLRAPRFQGLSSSRPPEREKRDPGNEVDEEERPWE